MRNLTIIDRIAVVVCLTTLAALTAAPTIAILNHTVTALAVLRF